MNAKCFLFLDTITGKMDAKGRISIPADYRELLKAKNTELALYRSFTAPCIEGLTSDLLEQMSASINQSFAVFSPEQDELTSLIYADSKIFTPDSTGRISLTEKLIAHAQLTDTALFVGKGTTFQVWNPELFEKEQSRLRSKASQKPLTFWMGQKP